MDRSLLKDTDLVRLSEAIDLALPSPDEPMMVRRAIIGESILGLSAIGSIRAREALIAGETHALLRSFNEVMFPSTASRIVLAARNERNIRAISEIQPLSDLQWDLRDEDWNGLAFIAPQALMMSFWMRRTAETEWDKRMELEAARTAIAVERYRLAKGSLPDSPEALVPEFLASVPEDAFGASGQPLIYRYFDDGEFVVYSVSYDGADNGGVERRNRNDGDITFSVAPLDFRTREQIAR